MAASCSTHQQNALSGTEPACKRRNVCESSTLYDVFINHRGPDVKKTLATRIYYSLTEREIRAFLDKDEMQLGDLFPSAIETAIRSAKVHIAIFSEKYAESAWCLNELLLMLESTAKIIPVFYQVKPSDLRFIETGAYAKAFIEHEKKDRYKEGKLKAWKEALYSISITAGEEFNGDGDYQKIVAAVQKEKDRKTTLRVADHLVGLNNLVEDFDNLCGQKEGKPKTNVVGIFGMGGVGKTTLAIELFNQKRSEYSKASFLFNVREGKLRSLQSKLTKDLFGNEKRFPTEEDGTSTLKDYVQRASVLCFLIVVDDIDHVDQLKALGVLDLINKSDYSLVIVTTRNVDVLIAAGITVGYNVKGMNRKVATELFCWHALRQSDAPTGYEELVNEFVGSCGGLPLSLKVLGQLVYGRTQDDWRLVLDEARRNLPREVKKRLKISFDALEGEQKQIFMDIACFFVSKSKSIARRVWEGTKWNFHLALRILKEKCLVEEMESLSLNIKGEAVFKMHDHLRDLGREVADELSPPQRLWRPQDLQDLRSEDIDTLLTQTNVRCFTSIFVESMGSQVTFFLSPPDSWLERSASFLWLQLEGNSIELPSIPLWIPLKKLQCLVISDWCFQTLWHRDVKPPLQLRELRIARCFRVTSLPEELCALQSLEHLELTCCPMLSSLPPRFGDLKNLKYFDLSDCNQLSELPYSFGQLTCLKYIRLSCCSNLTLRSDMLRNITKLECLDLTGCHLLEELPLLPPLQLRELKIIQCPRLTSLPEELCALQSLERLELSCLMLSLLPLCFGDLGNLKYVDISNCEQLEELPSSFNQLRCLKCIRLSLCSKLKLKLDMLDEITGLEYLELSNCLEVEELPRQITYQTNLTKLFVDHTGISEVPTKISELHKLEELKIGSPMLTSLPSSLGKLCSLNSLVLDGCPQLESLPQSLCGLGLLKQLGICNSGIRELCFHDASSSLEVTGIQASNHHSSMMPSTTERGSPETYIRNILPASLETLSLVTNHQLTEIRILPQSLNVLQISICKMLENVSGIGGLVKLRRLEIISCPELKELPSFKDLVCLQDFTIQGCPKVERVQGLEHCKLLQVLTAEVPLSKSLVNVEELRTVNLTCDTISALKPYILSMKKCPWEMLLRGRGLDIVEPIVEFLSSAKLMVLLLECDADWDNITEALFNAALLWYEGEKGRNVNIWEGNVVHIVVCRVGSLASLECFVERTFDTNPNVKKRNATFATSKDERVVEAFNNLIVPHS